MMLPVPVLDHVVVNALQSMDAAEAAFRDLGFTLTPRGHHTLGSINHLAVFATDYLELIALPQQATGRLDLLSWPMGWNGVVFATENAAALDWIAPVQDFSRPVEIDGAPRDAAFRTVRLPNETTQAGRLYFCQHKTRDLVWRDEWRRHPNGATGIARVVFAADNPAELGAVFARLFGAGTSFLAGLARIEVISRAEAAARYGVADPRPSFIAAIVLRVAELRETRAAIHRPLREIPEGLLAEAMGAAVVFAEA